MADPGFEPFDVICLDDTKTEDSKSVRALVAGQRYTVIEAGAWSTGKWVRLQETGQAWLADRFRLADALT